MKAKIRKILQADDTAMAAIIRTVMPEFGACGEGFAITDPEVDHLSLAYSHQRSGYYVVEIGGKVMGGAGYGQLAGAQTSVCELRKMYFLPEARGVGAGRTLMERICADAAKDGYKRIYLETIERMDDARRLYLAAGFAKLNSPMGSTGHFKCNWWYLKDLENIQ